MPFTCRKKTNTDILEKPFSCCFAQSPFFSCNIKSHHDRTDRELVWKLYIFSPSGCPTVLSCDTCFLKCVAGIIMSSFLVASQEINQF